MEPVSLISCASFAMSCARFIQREKTARVLRNIESEIILLRDRELKAAVELMDDARHCQNKKNEHYYIKAAFERFVEVVHAYAVDANFNSMMTNAVILVLTEKMKDFPILSSWRSQKEQKCRDAEQVLDNFQTSCIGAGICSFYMEEYMNAFKYFDRSLYIALLFEQQYFKKIAAVTNIMWGINPFKDIYYELMMCWYKDEFDCISSIESKGVQLSEFKDSNILKLSEEYNYYKKSILRNIEY